MSDGVLREIRPDRVAIYIRWSTEEQSDGTTLIEQREGCEFYIRSQGWFVNPELVFIDDGYSGGNLERPAMGRVRDLVRQGEIDCVVVLKIDRLSRNIVDATQLVLEEWKDRCHLRCVRQPIDTTSETGRMFFSILATFADFERAQIAERTYQGRIRRVREGKVASLVPFGLVATGKPGERGLHPEQAPVVAELFRRVLEERAGVKDLLAWLDGAGVRPPAGDRWNLVTLRRILRNPIYAGRIVYGATMHVKKPGRKSPVKTKRAEPTVSTEATAVPAIVSPEVFDAVQAILEERTEYHSRHRRATDGSHLLTGVARCRCGATINVHWANGVRYYWCSNRITYGTQGCSADSGTMRADHLDKVIVEDLLATFGDPEVRREAVRRLQRNADQAPRELEQEKERLTGEISRLDKRLNELQMAASMGEITLEEWRSLRGAVEAKRQEMSDRLLMVESSLKREAAGVTDELLILERMEALDRWTDLNPEERKELLRRLAHSIELFKPRGKKQLYHVKVTWRFAPAK